MNGNMVYEKLCLSFQNINEWLRFAETKNGVLFAFNGATIIGLLSLYKDLPKMVQEPVIFVLFPFLMLSLLVLLISFVPIKDKLFRYNTEPPEDALSNINLMYFGDLKNLSISVYLTLFYNSLGYSIPESFTKIEEDLAQQIVNNSAITDNKFIFFTVCAYINLLGFSLAIIILLSKFICTI